MTSKLTSQSCNFFKDTEGIYDKKCKIIIRYYGTLYFIVVIDEDESELGILDLTQNIVEVMDRIFESACEMDTLYYPEKVHFYYVNNSR
jgi:AP-3 complex subunit sigma